MSELVRAYEKYRSKRAQIKERQKAELERELEDYAVDVGRAVLDERGEGKTVDDILVILGNKNRNFVYDVINTAKKFSDNTLPDQPEAVTEPGSLSFTILDNGPHEYVVTLLRYGFDGTQEYTVTLHTDKWGKVVDMPEDWWLNATKEDKKVYKEIISTIEE